ncbi:MAG: hypothetical protein RR162_07350, partial [Oscillospiraceae bacterium]
PAIAAFLLLPIAYEFKEKTAFTLYSAVSLLAIFLIPDKELAMMYILVFGLYTVFKLRIDRIKPRLLCFGVKLGFSLVSVTICYALILVIFPIPMLVEDFKGMTGAFTLLLFALFAFTFLLYDFAISRVFLVYYYKFRPKIFKH